MSSTIDNINNNILAKTAALKNIIDVFDSYELESKDEKELKRASSELNTSISSYEFGSIDILTNYYRNRSDLTQRTAIYTQFTNFINNENIIGKIKHIYNVCRRVYRTYDIEDQILINNFRTYDYTPVTLNNVSIKKGTCPCGVPYTIESKNSEFICYECGNTEKLYGIVFEDEQFFYQEGQRTKHGKYDPIKHCRFWLERIQAKENYEVPKHVLRKIRSCIQRDSIFMENVTCPIIRGYLKECKLTEYNDHVPLIKKKVTGIQQVQLTDYEFRLVCVYFRQVIQIYNAIKPDDKPNCPYHPFFIYKIIEQKLKSNTQRLRKIAILDNIHLQSRETLIENDRIWERIIQYIPEFTYVPTQRR